MTRTTSKSRSASPRISLQALALLAFLGLLTACSSGSSKESSISSQTTANAAPVSSTFTFSQSAYAANPGSTVQLTVTGGTLPIAFSVVSGQGFVDPSTGVFTAPSSSGTTIIQAKDATGLIANTDVNYSSMTSTGTISIIVSASTVYVNSTVTLSASGGNGNYSFSKLSGEGTVSGNSFTAGPDAGTVQLMVTDSNNASGSASLTVSAISGLTLSPSSATVAVDNSIDFSASGGVSPYTFIVLSGPGSFTGASYLSSVAGTARIAVRDSVGHQVTGTITVSGVGGTATLFNQNLSITTDDQLGITMDNLSGAQANPVLVFFGTGSRFTDPTYISHTTSFCANGYNDLKAPCVVKIPLTNYDNSNPGSTTYEGTMHFAGRSGSGNIQFCIDPAQRQQVQVVYDVATSFAQARYPNQDRVLLGGRLIQAAYSQVDTNGGYGSVSITISNAGFTGKSSCGAPYTSGNFVQAFGY